MATVKKTDLPPKGNRNPDPITNAAGAHPIETGVGAALGGAGAGFVAGMAAGPIGAVVGTVAGGVLGGLAGKEVGEQIDPTIENDWVNEYYSSVPRSSHSVDDYRPAYRYGLAARIRNNNTPFSEVEDVLKADWTSNQTDSHLSWDQARPAVMHAYQRDISRCTRGC